MLAFKNSCFMFQRARLDLLVILYFTTCNSFIFLLFSTSKLFSPLTLSSPSSLRNSSSTFLISTRIFSSSSRSALASSSAILASSSALSLLTWNFYKLKFSKLECKRFGKKNFFFDQLVIFYKDFIENVLA